MDRSSRIQRAISDRDAYLDYLTKKYPEWPLKLQLRRIEHGSLSGIPSRSAAMDDPFDDTNQLAASSPAEQMSSIRDKLRDIEYNLRALRDKRSAISTATLTTSDIATTTTEHWSRRQLASTLPVMDAAQLKERLSAIADSSECDKPDTPRPEVLARQRRAMGERGDIEQQHNNTQDERILTPTFVAPESVRASVMMPESKVIQPPQLSVVATTAAATAPTFAQTAQPQDTRSAALPTTTKPKQESLDSLLATLKIAETKKPLPSQQRKAVVAPEEEDDDFFD